MIQALKGFLGSKKALAMFAGLIGIVGGWIGLSTEQLTPEHKLAAAAGAAALGTWIVNTYLKAQGQADQGKEAEKIRDKRERDLKSPPAPVDAPPA